MTHTFLMPLALAAAVAAAAACKSEPPAPPGPAYTPATADMLRALASYCQIQPGPDGGESRACRGRQATVRIELDRERRIRELDLMVLASTGTAEAWALYENVLPAVVGPELADAAHRKLRGEPVGEIVQGVRVATMIDGERYQVKLTWGR